ncbi:CAP GLY domain containing protein [Trichuris trichiura]|uniref:Tubulin-specific chaperone E n=1 Tax=Trichuris trichiura TaxID=36087 RepID=A0A077Z254_TRITR|nr:CAP GLY domain containing protein [Trichuris trichiura]
MPAVLLGCRVKYWDARGTVKYHGAVGKWIGIDWDEVDRGKHDGSHQNVQYFKTWSPRSGSFMRPGSVQYGCSLFEAVESRQYDKLNDSRSEGPIRIFASGKDATIEDHAGVNKNLEDVFVNITDLDLSHTLVVDWKEIVLMLRLMPNLKVLNLRHWLTGYAFCCTTFYFYLWVCFDELNKLPNLKRLIVRRNPICSSLEEATCRQFIIAKVRNLKVLNRVEVRIAFRFFKLYSGFDFKISPEERRGAELDYLQHFAAEWHSLQKEEEGKSIALVDFHRRHPRFRELVESKTCKWFNQIFKIDLFQYTVHHRKCYTNLISLRTCC